MEASGDSIEELNPKSPFAGSGFLLRWTGIIIGLAVALGFTLFAVNSGSASMIGASNPSAASELKISVSPHASKFVIISAAADANETVNPKIPAVQHFTLKGYVYYNRTSQLVPSIKITLVDRNTGYRYVRDVSGKFAIPVRPGRYDITMVDGNGYTNIYNDIDISSDSTIKFTFGSYRPPTPKPDDGSSENTNAVDDSDKIANSNVNNNSGGGKPSGGSKPAGRNPGSSAGPSFSGTSEFNSNVNVNVAPEEEVSDVNSNANVNTGGPKVSPPTVTREGFFDRLTRFISENPGKVALTVLAAAAAATLIWVGLPFLTGASGPLSGFLGGLAAAGKTAEVEDEVKCSVYSPPEVSAGSDLLVQVFAHLEVHESELDVLASELDPDSKKQLSRALKQKIKRDSVLTFKLMVPGIDLVEDEQDIVWRGEPESVEFIVPIPEDHADGNRFGRVFVYQNGEELGKIPFRVKIFSRLKPAAPQHTAPAVAGVMTQNESAFVSYASRDKGEVYRFVQLMDALKYEYHIDIFHIDAGERWEQKLYKFIDTDDVFLLFWSKAASESEWVIREAKRAEERARKDANQRPKIIIYNLQNDVKIPKWLEEFHVDRKWAGIIGNIKNQQTNPRAAVPPSN